jgi:hypothetical protein
MKNAPNVREFRTPGATDPTDTDRVSERKKRRSPRKAVIAVVIGLWIDRRKSPAHILFCRLFAVPSGRTAIGLTGKVSPCIRGRQPPRQVREKQKKAIGVVHKAQLDAEQQPG